MALRSEDVQATREQFLVDLVEQPVASSESTNEDDMLECKFKTDDNQENQNDTPK